MCKTRVRISSFDNKSYNSMSLMYIAADKHNRIKIHFTDRNFYRFKQLNVIQKCISSIFTIAMQHGIDQVMEALPASQYIGDRVT